MRWTDLRTPPRLRAVAVVSGWEERESGMNGFYWLIEGALAGCGRPGARGGAGRGMGERFGGERHGRAADDEKLAEDLAWLRQHGIGAVLSLTETPLPEEMLARQGLEGLHLPVDDLTAPTPEQLERALSFIDRQRGMGRAVAVHCLVGQGRTGTVLAAYLIRAGLRPQDALIRLRTACPGAVGSPEQERALQAFAERRDWVV